MWRPVNLGRIPDLVVGPCDLSCLGRLRVRGAYPWAWRPTRSFVCRTLIAAGIDSVTPACRPVRILDLLRDNARKTVESLCP